MLLLEALVFICIRQIERCYRTLLTETLYHPVALNHRQIKSVFTAPAEWQELSLTWCFNCQQCTRRSRRSTSNELKMMPLSYMHNQPLTPCIIYFAWTIIFFHISCTCFKLSNRFFFSSSSLGTPPACSTSWHMNSQPLSIVNPAVSGVHGKIL